MISYTFTINSISDDGSVASVTYVPDHPNLLPIERAVPVQLRKARDVAHASPDG